MKIERTRNASRNITFGIILKVYQIVCPFVIRTAMIYILGMEYVGLNSLFNSILQVLNLTELGVGTAMVYSMYKPIAEDDRDKICKLMHLYKVYYRIIGLIIAVVGIAITPVIPFLIKKNTQVTLNIYYLYWMNLGYTVLSYWLFAYKNSILSAHQRNDVVSKVLLITNTCIYIVQLLLLLLFKNYYYYLLALLMGQALGNVATAIVADRMYPQYKAKGKLGKDEVKNINGRIRDLFTSKIGGVVQNSSDSIIISAFLGLTTLAKYNNYYYILNSILGFVVVLFNSCLAGIGNSIVTESKEKNYKDLKKIAFLTEWLCGFCACSLVCLYQPFMKIWVGNENLLSFGVVICLAIYIYILITNQMLCLYKDASGIWHKDRYRPLITALANLLMNLALVNYWGVYGVVLSTVVSMLFIGMPWLIHNLFSEIFHRSPFEFVNKLIRYAITTVFISIVTFCICNVISDRGLATFFLKLVICLCVPNLLFFIMYYRQNEFKESLHLLNRLLGNRLKELPIISKMYVWREDNVQ